MFYIIFSGASYGMHPSFEITDKRINNKHLKIDMGGGPTEAFFFFLWCPQVQDRRLRELGGRADAAAFGGMEAFDLESAAGHLIAHSSICQGDAEVQ